MKKILKEWRTFLREADETDKSSYPTGTGARGDKYIQSLQTRRDITKKEALKLELAYHIVNIFAGFGDSKGVVADNVVLAHEVLDDIKSLAEQFMKTYQDVSSDYFMLYMAGSQREKRGSREKDTSVSYILQAADFYPAKASFEATEDIEFYVDTLDNMLEDDDYDFGLFDSPTERRNFFDTKDRSAGLGASGIAVPGGMSEEESEEFEKQLSILLQYDKYVKSALLSDEGPELFKTDAPIPRDYYHKQVEMIRKTVPAYRWMADAWERAIPRMTDKISRKHAEREAQAFANSAATFEKRAEELAAEISDPENLYNRFANVLRTRIPALEGELERDEYSFAELEKKIRDNTYNEDEWDAHETLKRSIPSLKKRLERTKKELSDMEKTHRSLKTYDVEPWSTVEPLIKAARQGDKQAATTADKILRALGRAREAQEMRKIARGRG